MQRALLVVSGLTSLYKYFGSAKKDVNDLITGVGMSSILPFTIFFLMPINNELLRMDEAAVVPEAATALLTKWGKLHSIRTLVSLAAFTVAAFKPFGAATFHLI
jgi:uncharacterized membrane protein